jgi:hypothetical protein
MMAVVGGGRVDVDSGDDTALLLNDAEDASDTGYMEVEGAGGADSDTDLNDNDHHSLNVGVVRDGTTGGGSQSGQTESEAAEYQADVYCNTMLERIGVGRSVQRTCLVPSFGGEHTSTPSFRTPSLLRPLGTPCHVHEGVTDIDVQRREQRAALRWVYGDGRVVSR